jgi:hypothetical protein
MKLRLTGVLLIRAIALMLRGLLNVGNRQLHVD